MAHLSLSWWRISGRTCESVTLERQAGEMAATLLAEGRHLAELDRAASAVVALNDQLAAADRSRQRDVRRLSIALAVVCALLLAAGALAAAGWTRWPA